MSTEDPFAMAAARMQARAPRRVLPAGLGDPFDFSQRAAPARSTGGYHLPLLPVPDQGQQRAPRSNLEAASDFLNAITPKKDEKKPSASAEEIARLTKALAEADGGGGGVDPRIPRRSSDVPAGDGYFAKTRQFESGADDDAVNPTSGATGRYQFMPSTWRGLMSEAPELGLTEDGIKDPAQQEAAMKFYTGKTRQALRPILGRDPTGGELYAGHMFGQAGAQNLIQNQDEKLANLFPQNVISSNPFLRNYDTGRDLLQYFNGRFG